MTLHSVRSLGRPGPVGIGAWTRISSVVKSKGCARLKRRPLRSTAPDRVVASKIPRLLSVTSTASVLLLIAYSHGPTAHADTVAYLVNVTVRPGYSFANADDALAYGHGICDKIASGRQYAQIMGDVKLDFSTADDFQGSYLITQAANELCPAQIWQLRRSAAGYRPPA
jgi:hypothetical protein